MISTGSSPITQRSGGEFRFCDLCPTGKSPARPCIDLPLLSSPLRKNILVFRSANHRYIRSVLSHQEGRWPTSLTRGRMRWTRMALLTRAPEADGEDVWSWHLDAGVKFLRSKLLRGDGGQRARAPGRARYTLL